MIILIALKMTVALAVLNHCNWYRCFRFLPPYCDEVHNSSSITTKIWKSAGSLSRPRKLGTWDLKTWENRDYPLTLQQSAKHYVICHGQFHKPLWTPPWLRSLYCCKSVHIASHLVLIVLSFIPTLVLLRRSYHRRYYIVSTIEEFSSW